MFCQTAVKKAYQYYQLYLWRNCHTSLEPDIYAMKRLMFGVSSSPFLAIQSVLNHARSPTVVSQFGMTIYNLLKDNMYMDDVHIGTESVAEVICMQKKLTDFFRSGGWSLVKFASNNAEVMSSIPEESRLPNLILNVDSNLTCKEASTLGLKWDVANDMFY